MTGCFISLGTNWARRLPPETRAAWPNPSLGDTARAGSEPFEKFSTLFHFSMGYKANVFIGSDPNCSVLTVELLQFYYSWGTARTLIECAGSEEKAQTCDNACGC